MTRVAATVVTGKDGGLGVLPPEEQSTKTGTLVVVHLNTGQKIVVPREVLVSQPDGSYYLPLSRTELEQQYGKGEDPGTLLLKVPVLAEELRVHTRRVETGRVRLTKVVREQEEIVDEPLLREEVKVERVPVGRLVEGPLSPRQEGDTLIIPVLEEILVVEKRLFLKEEVRVTTVRGETHRPQRVLLRREEVIVERRGAQEPPVPGSGPIDTSAPESAPSSSSSIAQEEQQSS